MIYKLKDRQKLAIVALALGLPILFLLYLLISEKNIAIDFARRELMGTAYLQPLRELLELIPQHERSSPRDSAEKTARIDEAFKRLRSVDAQYGVALRVTEKRAILDAGWESLRNKQGALPSEERAMRHAEIEKQVLDLISLAGDNSNLILDPDLDSYYAMDTVVVQLPHNLYLLAQVQRIIAGELNETKMTSENRAQLVAWIGVLTSALDRVEKGLRKGIANNPSGTMKAIEPQLSRHLRENRVLLDLVEQRLIQATQIDLRADELTRAVDQASVAGYQLWDVSANALNELLQARIDGFNRRKYSTIFLVLLVIALSIALVLYVMRSIIRPAARQEAAGSPLQRQET